MAWTTLQNSTTADADDVNNNFYHIAQGTRLPMGNSALESTDSAYDLGSNTYKWDNLHCVKVNATNAVVSSITSTNKSMWILESTFSVDATNSTTSRVEFTGLNGDSAIEYLITCYVDFSTTAAGIFSGYIYPNGDSASNCGFQQLRAQTTTVVGWRPAAQAGMTMFNLVVNSTTYSGGFIKSSLFAKTGYERSMLTHAGVGIEDTVVDTIVITAAVWNNTADTITSLVFSTSNMATGSTIQLWKRA